MSVRTVDNLRYTVYTMCVRVRTVYVPVRDAISIELYHYCVCTVRTVCTVYTYACYRISSGATTSIMVLYSVYVTHVISIQAAKTERIDIRDRTTGTYCV